MEQIIRDMISAYGAGVDGFHPQGSKPFYQMMEHIIWELIDDLDTLPKDNDVIQHAMRVPEDQWILDVARCRRVFGDASLSNDNVHMIEYIVSELIQLSTNVILDNDKKRLCPMATIIAIHNDHDLKEIVYKGYVKDYIPTLAELKQLGGVRWAIRFMNEGVDPPGVPTTAKIVYPMYEEWVKSMKGV